MDPLRIAVIDADTGFVRVLANRIEMHGGELRLLDGPPAPGALVALRLHALVVDGETLGARLWEYVERLGDELPDLCVVVCSQPSTVAQRVRGLRLGADDWVDKPCHPEELIARVESIVRRQRRAAAPRDTGPLVAGELEIRPDRFGAFVGADGLDLTRREFELLLVLAEAGGQVLPREDIYRRVWGYTMARGDRSVDVFVRKLRQKLEAGSPGWTYIHTHFGIGYRFQPEPRAGATQAPAPHEDVQTPARPAV